MRHQSRCKGIAAVPCVFSCTKINKNDAGSIKFAVKLKKTANLQVDCKMKFPFEGLNSVFYTRWKLSFQKLGRV